MLNKILHEKYGGSQHLSEKKRLKSKSASLVDFGARIKIKVSQVEGISQIELEATFLEDYEIHNETIDYLRELYGMSVGFTRFDDQHKVRISVKVNDAIAHFDSPQTCAMSLSQIRVQATGAPILKALSRMDDQREDKYSNEDIIYKLGTHGKCGTFHCISTNEK